MWRNYFTVAVRALAKNRAYSAINIAGLAIGMAACLLILLFVRYETSYDAALPGAENAYQFHTFIRDPDTGEELNLQMAAHVSKAALQKDFPQIETAVYSMSSNPTVIKDGQGLQMGRGQLVDGNLFDIVRMPFIAGDPANALQRTGSVVLNNEQATRLFGGTTAAMGKTLTLITAGKPQDLVVTGVVRKLRNTHMSTNFVARVDIAALNVDQPEFLNDWGWQSGWVYLRLRPGSDVAAMTAALPAWEKRNIPDQTSGRERYNQGDNADFAFVPIADVHLGRAQIGAMTPGNDARTITTFAIVALLILGMACVNFTNLATARAGQRAREVALRKVLGASRRQLIVQFLLESMLIAAVAMVLALAVVELTLPAIANFLQADLQLDYFGSQGVLLPVVALVVVVGLAAGSYPAFFLARFQPARVLKANKSSAEAEGSGRLRNILVVGQFAVSIGLIICTAIVHGQTVYARSIDPGFKRSGLIQIEAAGRTQTWPVIPTLIEELKRLPGVSAVGRTTLPIAATNNVSRSVQVPGRSDPVNVDFYQVDDGLFQTLELKILAGRIFDRNRPGDEANFSTNSDDAVDRALASRGINVVANDLAIQRLGFKSPQDAIGKQVLTGVREEIGGVMPTTIIGVVDNARFRSIREPQDPILFTYGTTWQGALLVRYDNVDAATANSRIETVWKRLFPDVPYDGRFSEDIVAELYAADDARARIFAGFAMLAVVIGCLGLFGLAAFTAERRTKEIGIRKVLGARTRDIVQLLVWQFSQPVLIANLIAWPVAWWVMRDWLNGFDARVALTPTPFILAGLLALGIATATIAGHAIRVARTSPIRALRYE